MPTSFKNFLLPFALTLLLSGCYSLGWRFDECLYSGMNGEVTDSGERQSFLGSSPTNVHGYAATDKTTLPTTVPAIYCRGLNLAINQQNYVVIPDHNDLSPTTAPGSSTMTAGIAFQANTHGNRALLFKEGEYGLAIKSQQVTFTLYNSSGTTLASLTSTSNLASGIPYLIFAHYEENYSGATDRLSLHIHAWDGSLWQKVETKTQTFAIADLSNTASDLLIGKEGNTYFDGVIDQAFLSDELLGLADIVDYSEAGVCRPCDTTLDHYEIRHAGSGVTCETVDVTFTGHDAGHTAVAPGGLVTLTLATSTGRGSWTGIVTGSGVLSDPVSGDGSATYQFPAGETSVTLRFSYPNPLADPDTVNFNITDGIFTEASGAADPALDDPSLSMATTGFLFYNATTGSTVMPVQIAAKPSDTGFNAAGIQLRAVKTSDETLECEPLFATGTTVTIELGAECQDPSSCQGKAVTINGSAIATSDDNGGSGAAGYTGVPLLFGGSDSVAALSLTYADVGALALHARYDLADPPASSMAGSTTYTVRPFAWRVTVPGNPAAADASGPLFRQAGADFSATVTAVAWQAVDDLNSDGMADGHDDGDPTTHADLSDNPATPNFGREASPEAVTLTALLDQPVGGHDPGLAGTTQLTAFSNGAATTLVRYDEVGIIELAATLNDGDYLGIGPAATAAIAGKSGYVGRFSPHHFLVTISPAPPLFTDACIAGNYSYLGEAFPFATPPIMTISAMNGAPFPAITQNYDCGGFWKFTTPLDLVYSYSDSSGHGLGLTPAAGTVNPLLADTTDCNGFVQLTLLDTLSYARPAMTSPLAPFAASVDLTVVQDQFLDSDLVCFDTGSGCQGFSQAAITGTTLRHGMIQVFNNFGPETMDITNSPFAAQYYRYDDSTSTSTWVVNDDDHCTTGLAFCSTPSAGRVTNIDPDPLAAGHGTFTVTTAGISGETIDVCLTAPTWLSDTDCTAPGPTCGTFTFGIYRGNDRIINWREVIQ